SYRSFISFLLVLPRPPRSKLFPYTTLFRSSMQPVRERNSELPPYSVHQLPWAKPNDRVKTMTVAIISLWFLLALSCSLLGVFDSKQRLPIPLGAAAILPVVVFAIWYLRSAEFRQFVLAANLRVLTLAQTW